MEYEWHKSQGLADEVLVTVDKENEGKLFSEIAKGFIMKSGPTSYTAWIPNDKGNRMEFFDIQTAKSWVFTQVRLNDGHALLIN
jgi:hypothetical protein